MNNPTLYVCAECANEDCESSGTNSTCLNCGGFVVKKRKQTNADRIRAMTDEEFAQWLDLTVNCAWIMGQGSVWLADVPRYCEDWWKWLKQEVEPNV